MRKQTAILTAAALLLSAPAVHAEAPTSQFGFKGWPYRQETNCNGAQATPNPTECPVIPTEEVKITPNPAPVPTEEPVATTVPTAIPTEEASTPTPAPTAAPTLAPTARPTAQPTARPTARPTAQPTKAPSMDEDYTTDSISAQEQKAWNLLNADRASNGLSGLTLDPELSRLARLKSEDMRDKHYFAHQSPTYGSASEMLKTFGYSFTSVGENIAHHATVDKAQAAFMSSDGHRRNILSSSWTKVGIGVCYDENGFVYLTQLFVR